SSEFVNPVTERPFATGSPFGVFTFWRIPDAWHTRATGFFAASIFSRRPHARRSFVRSQRGPWPPGKNTLLKSAALMSDRFTVLASALVALASFSKRRVSSVWNFGSLLLGSSGGAPPIGEASVISAPASRKTK